LVCLWLATAGAREPVLGVVEGSDFRWPSISIVAWGESIGGAIWRERRTTRPAARAAPAIART
jgi:hypothetical protein